ncbi:hypothetical protein [Isoptericola croceus]|uniref:hypothetical protein n=1 Tax=Isoptericola croceus TaxID=3031406 RepID=UPI0023F671C5|nr:hypothetical protein [Isoptericola croceus]
MKEWGSGVVGFAGLCSPSQLVAPLSPGQVFTRAERLRSGTGRTLEHWAGRLAAKHAVLSLLEVPDRQRWLVEVEVLPRPTPICRRTEACLHGHPPRALLGEALRAGRLDPEAVVRVSISHTAELALAVAAVTASLPEDDEPAPAGARHRAGAPLETGAGGLL